jgi:hypothetical protein
MFIAAMIVCIATFAAAAATLSPQLSSTLGQTLIMPVSARLSLLLIPTTV